MTFLRRGLMAASLAFAACCGWNAWGAGPGDTTSVFHDTPLPLNSNPAQTVKNPKIASGAGKFFIGGFLKVLWALPTCPVWGMFRESCLCDWQFAKGNWMG